MKEFELVEILENILLEITKVIGSTLNEKQNELSHEETFNILTRTAIDVLAMICMHVIKDNSSENELFLYIDHCAESSKHTIRKVNSINLSDIKIH